VLLASDVLMLGLATQTASLVRFGKVFRVAAVFADGQTITFARLSLVIAGIWIVSLWFEHLYNPDRVFWGTGEYARVVRGLSLGVVGFIVATYLLQLPGLSRGWTVLAWGFGIAFVILGRSVVRGTLVHLRSRGAMLRPTLIVGSNSEAAGIIAALRSDRSSGLVPIGCLVGSRAESLDECAGVPCLGRATDIGRILDERFVDTVLIASTAFSHKALAGTINRLRGRNVEIRMSSGMLDVTSSRVHVGETSGIPLITIRAVSFSRGKVATKRAFDLAVSGLIVLVGIPLWLIIALVIKLESHGSVFYRQERVGRGGKMFLMFKFRSMCDGADSQIEKLSASNEATEPLFKVHDDPRVTRFGMWMRRFSVDEFPQLLNVLRGEMSLVGPRPPLPVETAQYSEQDWHRMEVLPGMTGLWQVSGRSVLSFEEMVRLDLFYIENWSVGFDMGLILRTIPAVLFARGAY
jgi:exopolysaccharide biosynthesis polyprenyl glycosylphosphotransferase